jgi:hypothetical protein
MAGNIAIAINGVGAALAVKAVVDSGGGSTRNQVLLTNAILGAAGNVPILASPALIAAGFSVNGMSRGLGYDCPDGTGCVVDADCDSGVCCLGAANTATCPCPSATCAVNTCLAPSCSDGVLNGGETDVDCGGSCPSKCATGLGCVANADCIGGLCAQSTCQPTCSDGVLDNDETDVDCGGSCPNGCAAGQRCNIDGDCASHQCGVPDGGASGVCQ